MAASTPREGKARRNLLTVRAVAKRLGLSEGHVYLMAQQGDIPRVKLSRAVRFDPGDVDKFIRSHKHGTGRKKGKERRRSDAHL